jgi:hypothetical protein
VLTPTQARARLAHYARFHPDDEPGLKQRQRDLDRANTEAKIRRAIEGGDLSPEQRGELAHLILTGDRPEK